MATTVTRIKTATTAVRYFEEDNYYAKNARKHREASQGQWHGATVEALGHCGWIRAKEFEKILQEYVPGTSIRLGRRREDGHEHNPGADPRSGHKTFNDYRNHRGISEIFGSSEENGRHGFLEKFRQYFKIQTLKFSDLAMIGIVMRRNNFDIASSIPRIVPVLPADEPRNPGIMTSA